VSDAEFRGNHGGVPLVNLACGWRKRVPLPGRATKTMIPLHKPLSKKDTWLLLATTPGALGKRHTWRIFCPANCKLRIIA